jgi:hypothetical protein
MAFDCARNGGARPIRCSPSAIAGYHRFLGEPRYITVGLKRPTAPTRQTMAIDPLRDCPGKAHGNEDDCGGQQHDDDTLPHSFQLPGGAVRVGRMRCVPAGTRPVAPTGASAMRWFDFGLTSMLINFGSCARLLGRGGDSGVELLCPRRPTWNALSQSGKSRDSRLKARLWIFLAASDITLPPCGPSRPALHQGSVKRQGFPRG